MVFEDAKADSEVEIKIQDGGCDNFCNFSSCQSLSWFSRMLKPIVRSKSKFKTAAAIIF